MTPASQAAREIVASRYPEIVGALPDGSPLYGVCHRAIMAGAWDSGRLVQDAEARLREGRDGDG